MRKPSEQKPPKKPSPDQQPDSGWPGSISTWVFLLVSILAALVLFSNASDKPEVSYSKFRAQLSAGNVNEVTVYQGQKIAGTFKEKVALENKTEPVESFQVLMPVQDSEQLIADLEEQGVEIHVKNPETGFWSIFLNLLPWLILGGLAYFLLSSLRGQSSQVLQFGSSPAATDEEMPDTTFDDVAGVDEAKEELEEVINFLKDPEKFTRLGGKLPKGVLLVGPPGTGKTLLARAVAGEAGVPFFSVSGSDFVEMFVGVGASRIRDMFKNAKKNAPCIIFIDELDAVGRTRGMGAVGGNDEREQTLNQLLVEMDGFNPNEGIILIGATNRPDVLDQALLRPGRFDREVVVDAPDVRGREAILKVHTRELPLAQDVELGVIAKSTPGMTGAELENVANEAALIAASRDAERIHMQDFEQAKDKIMLGKERKSMVLSDYERELTAYHEAGHAIVSLALPELDPIHKVTIVPRGRAMGVTASLPEEDRHSYTKGYLLAQLAQLFGGRVAEEMVFGENDVTTGAGNDIQKATQIARRMVTEFGMSEGLGMRAVDRDTSGGLQGPMGQIGGSSRFEASERTAEIVDEEIDRMLKEAYRRAREVIEERRELLDEMARQLLEEETLDRESVETLAEQMGHPPAERRQPDLNFDIESPRARQQGEQVEVDKTEDHEAESPQQEAPSFDQELLTTDPSAPPTGPEADPAEASSEEVSATEEDGQEVSSPLEGLRVPSRPSSEADDPE